MHYDVGAIDGYFDAMTVNAVIAFQKVEGHGPHRPGHRRCARAGQDRRGARVDGPGGGALRVEVDVKRQILLLFQNNELFKRAPGLHRLR